MMGGLTAADRAVLERQDKAITAIIRELQELQQTHREHLQQCWTHLELREAAAKVITALKHRATDTLTGGDMSRLLRLLQADDVFGNSEQVQGEVEHSNGLVEGLIKRLGLAVATYKTQLAKPLSTPLQLFTPIAPQIDLKRTNETDIVVADRTVTVRAGLRRGIPVFLRQPIGDGQSFGVEVVRVAQGNFTVGVTAADTGQTPTDKRSLCFDAYEDGALHCDGRTQTLNCRIENGDTIIVRRIAQQIEWLRNERLLCSASIPGGVTVEPLSPVCWIYSSGDAREISQLWFL